MSLEIINEFDYDRLLRLYRIKGCVSNDYLQERITSLLAEGRLTAICGERNAFLLEKKDKCQRLYYYINDFGEMAQLDNYNDLVTEVLFRGDSNYPTREIDYLERNNFKKNLIRDQYSATFKSLNLNIEISNSVRIEFAETPADVSWACDLFNSTFDVYSGDYINEKEQATLLASNRILIAKDFNGKRLGALHYSKERNVAWVSHIAIKPHERGKRVGPTLIKKFIEINHIDDRSRYMLWVQRQNESAVAMYRNFGFKYINKSTISLVKY